MTEQLYEEDYQQRIVGWATLRGWELIYHTHDSRRSAVGFPDLVMLRRRYDEPFEETECMVLEVKGNPRGRRGRVTKAQSRWIAMFKKVPGVRAAVVWPDDWERLEGEIR